MSKVKAISGKPKANEFKARPPMMFALEPRFMFDGAAIASVAHGHGGESDVHAFDFSALRSNLAELVTQGGARPVADHTARIGSATRQTDNTKTTVATTTATDTVSLPAGRDVVIIDSSVADPQELVSLAPKGAEVYILNANSDGLTQISQILASGGAVAELQIIAHGGDGYFLVGNDVVSAETLSYHSGVFQSWASHMAQGADIMLYGCNVAESAQGQAMMEQIASWTGTTAAASTHDVGAHGDWTLDFTTGAIAAQEFNGQSYQYDLATLEVTSLADAATEVLGNGTLRGEIEAAVAAGTDEVIVFDPSLFTSGAHTITLSGGVLDASDTNALTIIGPGASLLTIDGHYASQIFKSVGASGAPTGVLTLQGMTLEHGQANSGAGGAVDASYSGGLTLDNVVVKDSKAIFNYGTSTGGYGGGGVGFSSYTSGAFTMNNSMIYGCTSSGPTGGGGLEASTYGAITISNSTIFNNTNGLTAGAGAYGGGAKLGVSSGGSISLVNDTFAGNTGAYGAALLISNNGGTAVIRNSTFTTNVITAPSGSNESGAIEIQGGTVSLYNNIIAGNTLGSGAVGTAGLFIAANSTAAGSHNASQETVAYSGLGGNGTNSLTSAISTTGINLGTLGFNGGPVETVALDAGSTAIGSGLTTGAPTTDARGDTRGAAIDLGAYAYSDLSTFSFDGSLFPANGYVDVPSTQNLVLDFGENVTAVSGKDIVIYNSNGTVFQTIAANDTSLVTIGAGTTADSEVTIAHNAFASDAGYYVEISSGAFVNAASLTFTGITNPSTWAFTSEVLPLPIVTAPNIHVSGDTGTGGDYKIGDVVTATWNDTAGGDNNSQTITGVTFNFSQFGGGTAVVATDASNVWTATYTITAGSIDATSRNVAVTATDSTGNTTTTGTNNVTVDDMKPAVTAGNISLSGASGTGGVFKIGDTVTATWNDGASGDNNTDTINAGGVTMDFSQFGGGTAVTATDSSGVWTATYVVTAGAIDTSTAHVAVTVTDHAGNATTTSGSVASVDDIAPIVTSGNISLSGGSGTGGAYKIGDIVTATWNDGVSGDNNTETINAGGVTMNFSQFGGGTVTATDSSGVWTATYTITAGAIDTNAAHVAVTATDAVGNATTTSSTAVTADNEQPVVTTGNISLSGATGAGGAFKVGDTVTATWNDGASGDNNTDTITAGGVTMDFSQFGGGTAVTATDSSGVWTATYVVTAGAIDTSTAHVAVTATDHVGNSTTTSSGLASVDDIAPIVTSGNISVSGGTGTGGAFKIGDTVTATWNDSGTGDNNTDTINAGGVTMNFAQFGGGTVTATDSSGVWTATYTITAGAIDTNAAHVAVTATDAVGNATTTSGSAVTADNEQPVVTIGNISLSGASGTGGAFKVGDTVTATWNDGASGDNNTDTITGGGVTMNFSQFGGGTAVTATDSSGVWTATYTITAGAIDTSAAHVAVTATDHVGNTTTTTGAAATVDDILPVVTTGNISLSGATGTGGAFKIGDTVTATWDDSGTGDNNTDTINAVTMNFSQFGGGTAVTATDSGGVWTATYTVTAGAIDTSTAHVAVTATDHAGNATTTSGAAAKVDDIAPIVTAGHISLSGGSGTSGAFKIGDVVTATWNDSGTGDNNSEVINAGGVTMNFAQFGGGTVTATDSSGVWTATYTITAGAIDTATAHVAVAVTDAVGNATTTSSGAVTADNEQPAVTAGNISLSGATGTAGAFKVGDTVTATWNDSGTGDNNTDTINAGGVTMNFSQFGGGTAVTATDSSGVWTATYVVTAGAIDTSTAHVAVTVTDHAGNATTTSSSVASVDDIAPIVTSGNISLSGGSGTGGAYKIGDIVTATWNDGVSGDNNTETINAGGVTMNFSQFGGGTVTATDSSGVWTATYTITAGAIDTNAAHVAVTATDAVGNATTTASVAVTADNEQPVVTTGNISLSGASGAGGAFKVGDTVTATWNDGASGDNNTDTITAGSVTMDFSQFGGGTAVTATDSSGVWTATYVVTAGAIDTSTAHVAVTATDHVGNTTTTSSGPASVDDIAPIVTSGNISVSGGSGTGGAFKIGDTVTATWNDSGTGDNNTDTINAGGVTMNFAQFGGGTVTATDSSGVWTATYTITAGAIDTNAAHVAVTATDAVGNATTTSSTAFTADNEQPVVTTVNISLSGASGVGGAFKIGDTVTATWNDGASGDNNTDTINVGGVTMNFSQFGGGAAVTATDSSGVWTATYTITAGAIDTSTAHVAVTATDHVGNTATTSSAPASVDDIAPIVTSGNISVSGGTGTSGAFKIGDTVTATWNDGAAPGDNNTDIISAVTMNFAQFGGGTAVTATDSGGVWTATYTVTAGSIESSTAHVAVTATDHAGNATTTSGAVATVDDILPVVTAGHISLSGGTGIGDAFKIGDTVTATWNDSGTGDNNTDTINAGGVTMDFSQFGGGAAVVATASGGVWTASYTITAGAIDTTAAHVAVTVTDVVGNATTTSGAAVTADNEQPVVTTGNISLSGATGAGGLFKIGDVVTATWNDSGTGDNNTDTINPGGVTMNFSQFGGGTAVVATDNAGVWTATYTITVGTNDTSTAHVAVTATDFAGNATTASSAAASVNDVAPIVTSIDTTSAALTNASTVSYTVTFSEAVTGVVASDFTLTDTGGTTGTIASVTAVSGSVYTVTVDNISGDGTMRLDLNSSGTGIADLATNPIAGGYTSGEIYTFDHQSPQVVSVGVPAAGTYLAGQDLNFTVTYNEAVIVNGIPELAVTLNTGVVYAHYVSGSGTSTLDFSYVVAAGNLDTNGIVVDSAIIANGATLQDGIGNSASLALNDVGSTTHVLVDGTDPTVASVDTVGNATTNAASVSYTVTFTEAVSGVNASDFTLTSTGSATGSIESVTAVGGSSNTYTVTVDNVSGAGTLRLDVNASSSIVDAAGTAVPGYTSGQSYTIDRIVPTVTEVSVPANGTYIDGQTLDFTVTYSTAVTLNTSGGEPTLTIELANGKTEQAQLLGASGNQLTFQYTVVSGDQDLTGIAIGSSVNLNGATLQDAFGNAADTTLHGVASTALIDVDAVAPTVTAVQVPAVGLYTPGEQLNLVVSYTEAVTVNTAGGTPGIAITLDSGTVIAHYVSGSGSNELTFSYTVASGNLDKAGIIVANAISTNGGSISSTDGNVAALTLNHIGSTANVDVGPAAGGTGRGLLPGCDNPPATPSVDPFVWVLPADGANNQQPSPEILPSTTQDTWSPVPLLSAGQQGVGHIDPGVSRGEETAIGSSGFTTAHPSVIEQIVSPQPDVWAATTRTNLDRSNILTWQAPSTIESPAQHAGDLFGVLSAPPTPQLLREATPAGARTTDARLAAHAEPHTPAPVVALHPAASRPAPSGGKASLNQQFSRYGKAAWEREKSVLVDHAQKIAQRRVG